MYIFKKDPIDTKRFLCVPNQFVPYADEISSKYIWRSIKMDILNKKHWKRWYEVTKYKIIEETGPVRHYFRNHEQKL